ncbi:tetratricopeptide repeat protein [Streptomyces virginiae]|uniref:tetratricopeptide repeat protein n=1 Tax=Streptomyces virginiae TaxID=1961 RepID=UPI0036F81E80
MTVAYSFFHFRTRPGGRLHQVSLAAALQRLHRLSGEPSTREVARRTHGALSHTTVSQTLRGNQLASWRSIELIVSALGGSVEEFRELWVAARDKQEAREMPKSSSSRGHSKFAKPGKNSTPHSVSAVNRARLIARAEGKPKAVSFLEKWQSEHEISPAAVREMTLLASPEALKSGRYEKLIDAAISSDYPESTRVAMWLSHECDTRGNKDRELFFLMAALRMDPNNSSVLYALGVHYDEALDLEKAAFFLRRAVEIKPDPHYLYNTVHVLCMLGLPREAAKMCQTVYSHSRHDDAADAWVIALMAMGEVDDALRVLREHSATPDPYALTQIGEILCEAGRLDEARSTYMEALSADASGYTAHTARAGLAYISLTEGKTEEATRWLSAVLDGNPKAE